jgi:hypothetical protein
MHLLTRFPDGTEVFAVPEPDADTIEQLHDLVHHLLAQALDLPHSPTLGRVARHADGPASNDLVAYEEAAVLAIQQYARALAED